MRLLADRAESAARKAGLPMGEHRRYKAHLTVARSRDSVDVRPYVDLLRAFTSRTWTVNELGYSVQQFGSMTIGGKSKPTPGTVVYDG